MGKTFSIKVLFGIYLLLMAGKVFAFSCNVDGGSSIGAGTTWICPYISRHLLSLNPSLAHCRRYSRGER